MKRTKDKLERSNVALFEVPYIDLSDGINQTIVINKSLDKIGSKNFLKNTIRTHNRRVQMIKSMDDEINRMLEAITIP